MSTAAYDAKLVGAVAFASGLGVGAVLMGLSRQQTYAPRRVHTESAPSPVRGTGPNGESLECYAQAMESGGFLWVSGQIGMDPATGALVEGGAKQQAEQVLQNLEAVLKAGGSSLERVVKVTVLCDGAGWPQNYNDVNEVYLSHFKQDPRPARAAFAVAALPKGALVEIECVAAIDP